MRFVPRSEEEVSARAHARSGAAGGGIAQSDLIAHPHVASGIEINWNTSLPRRRHDRLGDLDTARSLRQGDDARGDAVANTRTEMLNLRIQCAGMRLWR